MTERHLQRKANGYWEFRRTINGKETKRALETTDFETAKRRRDRINEDLERARWGEPLTERTFEEAVEKFKSSHYPNLRPRTK